MGFLVGSPREISRFGKPGQVSLLFPVHGCAWQTGGLDRDWHRRVVLTSHGTTKKFG